MTSIMNNFLIAHNSSAEKITEFSNSFL